MSYYDQPSRLILGHDRYKFVSQTMGLNDVPDPRANAHKWSENVAECHDHTCVYTWQGRVYDHVPVHGLYYCGRATSRREAICIWKGHLDSIGIHSDDAEVLRDDG